MPTPGKGTRTMPKGKVPPRDSQTEPGDGLPMFERCVIGRLDCIHEALCRIAVAAERTTADGSLSHTSKVARAAAAAAGSAVERAISKTPLAELVDLFSAIVRQQWLTGPELAPDHQGDQPSTPDPKTPAERHQGSLQALGDAIDGSRTFKCCSPNCPGFPWKASDHPHPPDVCTEQKTPAAAPALETPAEGQQNPPPGDLGVVFVCGHPDCPGYPWQATNTNAHPGRTCGSKKLQLALNGSWPGEQSKWLTSAEFGELIGCARYTAVDWCERHEAFKQTTRRHGNKHLFFHGIDSVQAWAELRRAGKIRRWNRRKKTDPVWKTTTETAEIIRRPASTLVGWVKRSSAWKEVTRSRNGRLLFNIEETLLLVARMKELGTWPKDRRYNRP